MFIKYQAMRDDIVTNFTKRPEHIYFKTPNTTKKNGGLLKAYEQYLSNN